MSDLNSVLDADDLDPIAVVAGTEETLDPSEKHSSTSQYVVRGIARFSSCLLVFTVFFSSTVYLQSFFDEKESREKPNKVMSLPAQKAQASPLASQDSQDSQSGWQQEVLALYDSTLPLTDWPKLKALAKKSRGLALQLAKACWQRKQNEKALFYSQLAFEQSTHSKQQGEVLAFQAIILLEEDRPRSKEKIKQAYSLCKKDPLLLPFYFQYFKSFGHEKLAQKIHERLIELLKPTKKDEE